MGDFSDPINRLKEDLEDLRQDIDLKDKDLKKITDNLKDLERQKELTEGELEDLREQEDKMMKDIERMEIESR